MLQYKRYTCYSIKVQYTRTHQVQQIPGEEDGVAYEEDGRVVAHQVPVALLRVELDGEPAWVTGRVCRAALASHLRKER